MALTAKGQQAERMRRIGLLVTFDETDRGAQLLVTAFMARLEEQGWMKGRNINIDIRWGAGERDRRQGLAEELVNRGPNLILAVGGSAAPAISHASSSLPIVFVQVVDPIALGLVSNLAKPGGNITGFTNFELTIGGKWVQTLTEISAGISSVAVMFDPENTTRGAYFQAIEEVARSLGIRLSQAPVHNSSEIESTVDQFAQHSVGGLIVLPYPVTQLNRKLTLTLPAQRKLPAIYPYRFYTEGGGLMSYGIDLPDLYRRAASYVDRILRGEKAADLPVQQPTKFELVINMRTAKALGLSVPQSLLSRADEVIE